MMDRKYLAKWKTRIINDGKRAESKLTTRTTRGRRRRESERAAHTHPLLTQDVMILTAGNSVSVCAVAVGLAAPRDITKGGK